MGGLGLFTPTVTAAQQHTCSMRTCSPLVDLIVSQSHDAASCFANQFQLHSEVHATQQKKLEEFARGIYDHLPADLRTIFS